MTNTIKLQGIRGAAKACNTAHPSSSEVLVYLNRETGEVWATEDTKQTYHDKAIICIATTKGFYPKKMSMARLRKICESALAAYHH